MVNEPAQEKDNKNESNIEWLNRLNESIALSMDEELPDIPRSKEMRPPIILHD